MIRVKMIITSVVVLAIVGSAFAFNIEKGWVYCVTDGAADQNCFTIQSKRTNKSSDPQFRYYPNWDGFLSSCTSGGTNTCNTLANFTIN